MVSITEIDSDDIKYWAISLEVICIDEGYQGNHIGTSVLGYIVEQAREVSNFVGCRYLVLDAIKQRAEWYERRGFSLFNPSEIKDENPTVKMFIDFQDESLVNDFFEI